MYSGKMPLSFKQLRQIRKTQNTIDYEERNYIKKHLSSSKIKKDWIHYYEKVLVVLNYIKEDFGVDYVHYRDPLTKKREKNEVRVEIEDLIKHKKKMRFKFDIKYKFRNMRTFLEYYRQYLTRLQSLVKEDSYGELVFSDEFQGIKDNKVYLYYFVKEIEKSMQNG